MGRKNESDKADRLAAAEAALSKIAETMSVREWDGVVSNRIADILHEVGVEIPEPDPAALPPATCPVCGKRDELMVRETAVISFQYDPYKHTGNTDTERTECSNEDYTAYCAACQRTGTLAEFQMALVDWIDDSCLDDEEDDDGE